MVLIFGLCFMNYAFFWLRFFSFLYICPSCVEPLNERVCLLLSSALRAAFKYEGSTIVPAGHGTDYADFKSLCTGKTP